MWWIFGGKLSVSILPRKIGLNFITENSTTFFTARKDICHLELALGASSPNKFWTFLFSSDGAWFGLINCLAARNLVSNSLLFLQDFHREAL